MVNTNFNNNGTSNSTTTTPYGDRKSLHSIVLKNSGGNGTKKVSPNNTLKITNPSSYNSASAPTTPSKYTFNKNSFLNNSKGDNGNKSSLTHSNSIVSKAKSQYESLSNNSKNSYSSATVSYRNNKSPGRYNSYTIPKNFNSSTNNSANTSIPVKNTNIVKKITDSDFYRPSSSPSFKTDYSQSKFKNQGNSFSSSSFTNSNSTSTTNSSVPVRNNIKKITDSDYYRPSSSPSLKTDFSQSKFKNRDNSSSTNSTTNSSIPTKTIKKISDSDYYRPNTSPSFKTDYSQSQSKFKNQGSPSPTNLFINTSKGALKSKTDDDTYYDKECLTSPCLSSSLDNSMTIPTPLSATDSTHPLRSMEFLSNGSGNNKYKEDGFMRNGYYTIDRKMISKLKTEWEVRFNSENNTNYKDDHKGKICSEINHTTTQNTRNEWIRKISMQCSTPPMPKTSIAMGSKSKPGSSYENLYDSRAAERDREKENNGNQVPLMHLFDNLFHHP